MRQPIIEQYRISLHFLDRYVYRFQDNSLENVLNRVNRLKPLTTQQYNRVKKRTQRANKNNLLIDKDLVVLVKNETLVTCWYLP